MVIRTMVMIETPYIVLNKKLDNRIYFILSYMLNIMVNKGRHL